MNEVYHTMVGIFLAWGVLGTPIAVLSCYLGPLGRTAVGFAYTSLLIFLIALSVQHKYNKVDAKLVFRDELRSLYEEELPKLDENLDKIKELNPDALFLSNQDSPIATTMILRSNLIKRMTQAEREAIEAMKVKFEIENSVFSVFI